MRSPDLPSPCGSGRHFNAYPIQLSHLRGVVLIEHQPLPGPERRRWHQAARLLGTLCRRWPRICPFYPCDVAGYRVIAMPRLVPRPHTPPPPWTPALLLQLAAAGVVYGDIAQIASANNLDYLIDFSDLHLK